MEFLGSIFRWIGTNESVLSGLAATIVILGVLYVPIRTLLRRAGSGTRPGVASSPDDPPSRLPTAIDRHAHGPSIAVMPFANLSGDASQEFLADGLTEDIILGLSRYKQLFVIARNTCFTYKGSTPDAQRVSQELGVRYVLEGSVRKVGDRIRITAQLVDARTRTPKWAERFDRQLEEILAIDDEVTEAIVTALQPALRRAEAEQARRAAPGDLTAWALVNQAWVGVQSDLGDVEVASLAIRACEEALELDSEYAFAHAVLAHATSLLVDRPRDDAPELRAGARASIERALALAPDDALVHHCHAAVLANLGDTHGGVRAWERAIELDPNNAGARAGLGIGRIYQSRPAESLDLIDGALRRSPADPLQYHWLGNRAFALLLIGRADEAIGVSQDSLQRKASRLAYAVHSTALACEGRLEEAHSAWRERERRFESVAPENLAKMVSALAPDAEWAEMLREAVLASVPPTTAPR